MKFKAIVTNLEELDSYTLADLSSDQHILLLYMLAISSGVLDANVASRQVGPL